MCVCRIIWWGGNPLVNEDMPDIKFQLPIMALRCECLPAAPAFMHR
jgi:hypothetical protein